MSSTLVCISPEANDGGDLKKLPSCVQLLCVCQCWVKHVVSIGVYNQRCSTDVTLLCILVIYSILCCHIDGFYFTSLIVAFLCRHSRKCSVALGP